ncbi:MAG: CHAT domain-containing protein [Myxococcota bacterium]|jgi:CHAT domain-containing protein
MTPTDHRLILDLSLAAGELRATLTRSGPRLAPVQTWASREVDLVALRALQMRMTAVLNRANRWGDMDQGSRALLRQRGALLFDDVLPRVVKDALRELGTGELTLVLDEALVFVPWELMHTGAGFIGLDWMVGRIVRTPHAILGQSRPQPLGPWRMLILCDPRGDLLGSYYEGITLRDQLDDARKTLAIDLRSSEVGLSDVKQLVREYDLIHYAGHAELHPDRPADSGWLLSDGVLNPEDVLSLAGGQSFPRVVFSNACRSGQVDGSLLSPGDGEAIFSVANAFLLAGVHHYIGTLWDIPDEPACHFSLAFYESLAAGATLGESLRDARHALATRYGEDSVLWASYLLYGDPSVPCFAPSVPASQTAAVDADISRPEHIAIAPPQLSQQSPPRSATTRVRGAGAARSFAELATLDVGDISKRMLSRLWPIAAAVVTTVAAMSLWLAFNETPTEDTTVRHGPFIASLVPARYDALADFDPSMPLFADETNVQPAVAATPAPALAFKLVPQSPADVPEHRQGAVLQSGENFRLHYSLARPAHVTVLHIESQGAIRVIHQTLAGASKTVALPTESTWFFLDERRGLERFVLAVSEQAAPDMAAVLAGLEPLARALTIARGQRTQPDTPLHLRGLGGQRPAQTPETQDERAILDKIDAHLLASFDAIRVIELVHR